MKRLEDKPGMFDGTEELLKKVRLGEDSSFGVRTVRFRGDKVAGPCRDDLADEISAFTNTRGGVILMGVDDKSREIVGIPPDRIEAVEHYILEICKDSVNPPVHSLSFHMLVSDTAGVQRHVLKVEIPRSLFIHESPGGYFHRQGSSKRKIPPDYLARLFQQRSQTGLTRFEEQPVHRSGMDDLSEPLWRKHTTRSDDPPETVLLKRSLLSKEENGTVAASVAGVLLCCENPERFLPNAFIQAVRYRGVIQDGNYQTDAQDVRGPLGRQVKHVMAFFKRNQAVAATKEPHRVEKPQFSERAVFEAVVNAVAHRDYSVCGSKIRFFMFDDRLEIYSPGGLPNTVTVDSMALRQSTRNELVTSLLAETPVAETIGDVGRSSYMEKRGDGVPIILRESERLSGKTPVYRLIDDSELLLTIYSWNENDRAGDG